VDGRASAFESRVRRIDGVPVQPFCLHMVRTAIDLKIFELLAEAKGNALSCEELASKTGADPVLLGESTTERHDIAGVH
jgi:hypothetical protein